MFTTKIPDGFSEKMHSVPGLDATQLIQSLDTDASVSIRLNRRKPTAKGVGMYTDMSPVTWCSNGYYLQERPVFTLNPLLHAGAFYVQDASSMIHQQVVEILIDKMGGGKVTLLDFCAAPGGKTTAMINALPDGSVVVANEYMPARGKILRENLEKWGYPAVITTGSSSDEYACLPQIFDIIAVDAPCSGEGMMRKEEEARRQWTPKLVDDCAKLQRSILNDITKTLRPGGYLIYSTCTFNLDEDELNSRFIQDELGLEPVKIDSLGIDGIETVGQALMTDVEALRFMPHITRGEGLYLSIFRKPGIHNPYLESVETSGIATTKKSRQKEKAGKFDKKAPVSLSDENRKEMESWFNSEWEMQFEQNGNLITTLPAVALPILTQLRKTGVRITGAGLPVAEIKGRDLVPDSRVALSAGFQKSAFPNVELNEEDALRYLRRDTITMPSDTPKGFVAVSFNGQPLGLVKNLGNRSNNLFPTAWRIRI